MICNKADDDGILLHFKNLTNTEYNLINGEQKWLPAIPEEASSVNIEYFRDLAGFSLTIQLTLPLDYQLDTVNFQNWKREVERYTYYTLND